MHLLLQRYCDAQNSNDRTLVFSIRQKGMIVTTDIFFEPSSLIYILQRCYLPIFVCIFYYKPLGIHLLKVQTVFGKHS